MSAVPNLLDIGALGGERFRRRVPLRGVIGPLGDSLKLALLTACRELGADLGKGRLAHAAPKRSGHDRPLVGNSLAFEKMLAGEGHRLLCADGRRLSHTLLDGSLPRLCNDPAGLIAELGGDLPMCLQHLLFGEVLFLFAGDVRGDLCGFRPLESIPLQMLPDLSRPWAGRIKVLLRVGFDFGGSGTPTLQFVAQLAELVHQVRLVHRRRVTLALKEGPRIKGPGRTVITVRYVEHNGMGVELGGGVSVYRAGGVVLELGRDKPPGLFGRVVAANPRVGVSLQFGERGSHRLPVSQAHAIIPAHKSGQGYGLGRGKGRIPTRPVLHSLGDGTIWVGLFACDAMLHHLLAGLRMLTIGESHEVGFADGSR